MQQFKGDIYIHPQQNTLCWLFNCNIFSTQTSVHTINHVQDLAQHLSDYKHPYYEELSIHIQLLLKEIQPNYVLEKDQIHL